MRYLLCLLFSLLTLTTSNAASPDSRGKIASPFPGILEEARLNWTGYYAGVNLGWLPGSDEPGAGYSLGGHIGYNHHFSSNLVLGAEVDLEKAWSDRFTLDLCDEITARHNWGASARVRLGYATGVLLPYLTVGPGYRSFDTSNGSDGVWAVVWGGGIDWRVTKGISLRAEYLRFEAGERRIGGFDADLTDSVVRFATNIHF